MEVVESKVMMRESGSKLVRSGSEGICIGIVRIVRSGGGVLGLMGRRYS